MRLTSLEALNLINKEQGKKPNNGRWINHSICVGNAAGVIVKTLG